MAAKDRYWYGEVEFTLKNGTTCSYAWSWRYGGRGRPSTGRVISAGRDQMRAEKVRGRSQIASVTVVLEYDFVKGAGDGQGSQSTHRS